VPYNSLNAPDGITKIDGPFQASVPTGAPVVVESLASATAAACAIVIVAASAAHADVTVLSISINYHLRNNVSCSTKLCSAPSAAAGNIGGCPAGVAAVAVATACAVAASEAMALSRHIGKFRPKMFERRRWCCGTCGA